MKTVSYLRLVVWRLLSQSALVFVVVGVCSSGAHAFAATSANSSAGNVGGMKYASVHRTMHKTPGGRTGLNNAGGVLTFDEEFSGDSLDTTMWNIQDDSPGGYQDCCLAFGEQYFTPQALSESQGALHITSDKQSVGGKDYTSGAITTENKFAFLYGRVDVSARLPQGRGVWPAFWLLDSNDNHEVNIMEMAYDPTNIIQVSHVNIPAYNGDVFQCHLKEPDLSTDFHKYSLAWYPTSITWFVDDVPTCQVTKFIPQTPMYLLLNTAVGGKWPGSPDANTTFPQSTDIDYVQVSQAASYDTCLGMQVTSPLQLAQATAAPGDTITGTVTYTNNCTAPINLRNLVITAQPPSGDSIDFDNALGSMALLSGQSAKITASYTIQSADPTGQWYAYSRFQTPDGQWHADETNRVNFTVAAK